MQWRIVYELLTEPMPVMLWIASFTEAAIQNYPDMSILLAIQFINASLGFYEIVKAGDAVAALKASLKPQATVKRDGKWQNVHAGIVVPGDLVLLASGSAIPADCIVNEGVIEVDQAALTGVLSCVCVFYCMSYLSHLHIALLHVFVTPTPQASLCMWYIALYCLRHPFHDLQLVTT